MAGGRPSLYEPKYHIPWATSLAMEGLTVEQIAERFGVGHSTFKRWMKDHDEFRAAVTNGREAADARVEMSLFRRAEGYTVRDKKVVVQMDADGNQKPARIETNEKEIAGDVVAQIFWLKNRRPDKWRDRTEGAQAKAADEAIKEWIAVANVSEEEVCDLFTEVAMPSDPDAEDDD